MKRTVLLIFAISFFIFGCSKKNPYEDPSDRRISKIKSNTEEKFEGEQIGIDLTEMNSNMVYAQVFNMLIMPEEYEGRLIKVGGTFVRFVPNGETEPVNSVIVSDALACCQQGLEFKFADDYSLEAEDLPSEGTEIEIIGRFVMSQTPDGLDYFYLDCKDLKIL
ncbi:MAG: hypothetical protein ACTTJG_04690 [Treponema sp.]